MSDKKIKLVLCWHMHQPEYRDLQTGLFKLPWTYLHVIKDYIDMVAHLEAVPNAKAVVNFAPILLEQIEDYTQQVKSFQNDQFSMKDPLLAALSEVALPADLKVRHELILNCMKANRERQIDRYPAFKQLVEMAEWMQEHNHSMSYLNAQFMADFLVWYHLSWMGETVKLEDKRIQRLIAKERNYTLHDRLALVDVIGELLTSVLTRYKKLAHQGQIELSVTPYAHPIMPLMLDLKSTHDAMPDAALPELDVYPGGEERVRWHLKEGVDTFHRFFGFKPQGCWPSEGALSDATLKILGEADFKWTATGGGVLHNSLNALPEEQRPSSIHHPFEVANTNIPCFFRDDGLSDLIGFKYSKWHADDAVGDLINHIASMAEHEPENSVVSIIMDGENAWEYFPENGYHFLRGLYERLADHPTIELTTFSECLDAKVTVKPLPKLTAGSWVYGSFSTWIGSVDKNRGWDMLGDVKWIFDKVKASGRLSVEQIEEAEMQLAVCEGSDWFWWFGDYNPSGAVSDFEQQFRLNLTNLYYKLGEQPPEYLKSSFTQGSGEPASGGTMRKVTD